MKAEGDKSIWPVLLTGVLILLCVVVLSNAKKKNNAAVKVKEEPKEIVVSDKYMWIDEHYCLHNTGCLILKYPDDGPHRVQFIKREDLKRGDFGWYCPGCISVSDYEGLQDLLY